MKRKGILAGALAMAMTVSMLGGINTGMSASAAKAPKLSAKSKSAEAGTSFTLKVKNNGTKIVKTTWKTSKKKFVTISKKKKTSVKVKAKAKGSSVVSAKVKFKAGKKTATRTLKCKVKVVAAEAKQTTSTQAPAGGQVTTPTQASVQALSLIHI